MRIDSIYISPVKSLALQRLERASLGKRGIPGDRLFFLIDDAGKVITQREIGALALVRATYTPEPEGLRLEFPDGSVVDGALDVSEGATGNFYSVEIEGALVEGDWSSALSAFAGVRLRLVRAAKKAFDMMPLSICSVASLDALRVSSGEHAIEERRFRQNIYLSGTSAHEEDTWIGGSVRLGSAVAKVHMADPRCVMITHNPVTGLADLNTLKMIAAYRTDQPKEVNFGVYASIETAGEIAVGDEVARIP